MKFIDKCQKYVPFDADGWLGKDDSYCLNCMQPFNIHKVPMDNWQHAFGVLKLLGGIAVVGLIVSLII